MQELLQQLIASLDATLRSQLTSGLDALTIHQLAYLEAVHALGAPTITEIAARLRVSKPSVTAAVQRLVRLGYLQKSPSPSDRRAIHIHLSPKGLALAQSRQEALQRYETALRAALTADEVQLFQAVLAKLTTHIQTTTQG